MKLHLFRPEPFRPADAPPPQRLLGFVRWALGGLLGLAAAAFTLSALSGVTEVMTAAILGRVIDAALQAGPETLFTANWLLLLGFAAFFLILRPAAFAASTAVNTILLAPNVSVQVLARLHRWTMGQAVKFFDDDFAGRIAQKQMQAARALSDVVVEVNNTMAYALASILGAAALLATISPSVAALLLVWLIGYLGLIRGFLPRIRQLSAQRAGARSEVSGQIVDTIGNIKTVKLFAHADHEDRAALSAMEGYRRRYAAFGRLSSLFRLLLMVIAGALPVLLIGATLLLWTRGAASPGDIAAAGAVAIRIAQMTGWVSFTLMNIYANLGEVEDGMRTLAPPLRLEDRPGAPALPRLDGAIRFEGVGFAYGRQSGGVTEIDFAVAPGERVGIVGASGAGKSTLVALLLRLYDVETGRITIDGHDIRDVTRESLRRQIAMVTQETAMFNRPARENILYGRPDAGEAGMIAAARRAEAHEFILDLEDHRGRSGYDAFLGERGVKLSGGQRQRIALARALLKDSPILVLDEATSALDSEVEASIQSALERAMEGKTVLAIAHRLSTLVQMDRIVVLESGRIVEEGTHDELLRRGGLYARYWARQSGGFIGAEAAE